MATIEENTKVLKDLFSKAISQRLCSSKKEFAEMVGVTRESITNALNGNPTYATDKMVCRVTRALEDKCVNIIMENNDSSSGNVQKNFQEEEGDDFRYIVDRLVDEMAKQRESYERILLASLQRGQKGVI